MVCVSAQVSFKNWCPACAAFCRLCRVLPHFVRALTDARLFARRVNEVAVEVVAAVAVVVVEVVWWWWWLVVLVMVVVTHQQHKVR
jgi:hypothetical protein